MDYNDSRGAMIEFEDQALKHDLANRSGDYKIGNQAAKKLRNALKHIRKTNPFTLEPMLQHENDNVRCWAAMFWLEVNEERGLRVLKEIEESGSFYSYTARLCIREWNRGNLRSDQWAN